MATYQDSDLETMIAPVCQQILAVESPPPPGSLLTEQQWR